MSEICTFYVGRQQAEINKAKIKNETDAVSVPKFIPRRTRLW